MNTKKTALLICTLLLLHTACTQAEKSGPKTAGAASEASAPQSGTQNDPLSEWDGDDPDDRPDERTAAIQERCRSKLRRPDTVDDLTVKLYRTGLKYDCLYHMGKKELRKIWEIPVMYGYLSYRDPRLKKKVENARLGIYIFKIVSIFPKTGGEYPREYAVYLNDAGLKNPGSLFPSGNPPVNMPEPIKLIDPGYANTDDFDLHPDEPIQESSYRPLPDAQLKGGFNYAWINGSRGIVVPVEYITGLNYGAVITINVTNDRKNSMISDHNISESRRIVKELKKLREIREKREQLEKQKHSKNRSN